jgi:inorganic pyrophosphatase
MAKRSKSRRSGLADPTTLAAIEGNRNKYAYDPKERIFALKKVLPAGMAFPYDFGFVPSTQSGDGDPLDVLVLMDEPAFPGVKLSCRIVGVIQGEQGTKNNTERNDRIVAIENQNHSYAHVKRIDDLGSKRTRRSHALYQAGPHSCAIAHLNAGPRRNATLVYQIPYNPRSKPCPAPSKNPQPAVTLKKRPQQQPARRPSAICLPGPVPRWGARAQRPPSASAPADEFAAIAYRAVAAGCAVSATYCACPAPCTFAAGARACCNFEYNFK